ncbi:hypothetical protein [Aeromonas salmonicida]|uniref:hypothetical protein n=1 Tax=Aeromonas salmonicida TaxID=645 RepID=UPI003D249BA1
MAHQDEFGRQERLFSIIHAYFGSNNDRVVEAILETTGQKVTVRSVQAWLIAPNKVSHRRVPDWALKGLEDYIQQPGRAQELKEYTARTQERRLNPNDRGTNWICEMRSQKAVEFATREIEFDEHERQQWVDMFGKSGGEKLFERFSKQERELSAITIAFDLLQQAIQESKDIDQLKERSEQLITSNVKARYFVRQAREDIERGVKEFSNDEGLPTSKAKN